MKPLESYQEAHYIAVFQVWLAFGFSHWDAAIFAGIEFKDWLTHEEKL